MAEDGAVTLSEEEGEETEESEDSLEEQADDLTQWEPSLEEQSNLELEEHEKKLHTFDPIEEDPAEDMEDFDSDRQRRLEDLDSNWQGTSEEFVGSNGENEAAPAEEEDDEEALPIIPGLTDVELIAFNPEFANEEVLDKIIDWSYDQVAAMSIHRDNFIHVEDLYRFLLKTLNPLDEEIDAEDEAILTDAVTELRKQQGLVDDNQVKMAAKAEDNMKKAAAASTGALLTSLFVTPLDVAKVRIQSQIQTVAKPKTLAELRVTHTTVAEQCRCRSRCACNRCVTRPVEKLSPSRRGTALPAMRMSCSRAVAPLQLQGTSHALRHIFQTEGLAGLFAGLSPAMVIAVPSTVLYYISYDLLLQEGQQKLPQIQEFVPLLAGATARVVAASITSPIELIRTRMQGEQAGASLVTTFQHAVRRGGYRSLMNGLGATLARDVPFSAIYWTSYESLQKRFNSAEMELTRTQRAFACGAVSGAVAATVTTPFDVVKTLQQVSMTAQGSQPSGMAVLRQVVDSKGLSGAFTGLSARLARVAPSCAVMISCYELGKEKLGIA
ncbi:hypothetical protein BBO99_00009300 [Phytophthora kernoviae]|uniref:Uncharacterized protein n=2 Tax=Phytophthora kernoviae TaxID=325452 RepID=A0A3R7JUP9_9STRA|nr:hypothetical protein G195_010627 [Phytophthora kernoviae 00238/432]KAG2507287.1 hypothetical protein JM16_009029 [Phytophthora kernoviae]RLN36935.1 hypothetical protein BBI17_009330 [Phytophthora kernoviae]RLN73681.1 hypothetical protein BBO99_00009300 [Phytophthora kernoviae]